ncbi:MAG: sporulation initiation factor Spo0A [Clostridia bacterium]|nr:sporulation initiation factor Spo0A [Clostridia bacterium]
MKNLYKTIAEENKTTPYEVEDQIEIAIRAAMNDPSPEAQEFWKQLSQNGKEPSPEDVINAVIAQIVNGTVSAV